jgi:hypothetical protein
VTNLVVLDGEENETVGVLLKEGLVGLSLLDRSSNLRNLKGLLDGLGVGRVDGLERRGRVLLADGLEVELLNGGVAHLEVLEGGSSLGKHTR